MKIIAWTSESGRRCRDDVARDDCSTDEAEPACGLGGPPAPDDRISTSTCVERGFDVPCSAGVRARDPAECSSS